MTQTHHIPLRRAVTHVVKQVHPDLRTSAESVSLINDMMDDLMNKLAIKIKQVLDKLKRNNMLHDRHLRTAIHRVLPGELEKHAYLEMNRGITIASKLLLLMADPANSKSTKKAKVQERKVVRDDFHKWFGVSIPSMNSLLRAHVDKRVKIDLLVPYALASVASYVMAEILELAGIAAKYHKRSIISPVHVMLAVREDSELIKLFRRSVTKKMLIQQKNYHDYIKKY